MRLGDLWASVTGYLRIRVTGPALERFVNLAASRGLRLWGTRRRGRTLEGNLTIDAFRRLGPISRRTRSRVRIVERHGLPFTFYRARRRPLLVAGAIISLAVLYVLSATIWVVRVDGANQMSPDLIREVAAAFGLRPGTFKPTIDHNEVERQMMLAVNGLSWVAIEIHGTVALIRVVEKEPLVKPELIKAPADVVAAKGGVITSLIPLAGQPVVKEGDTVKEGQVLILGAAPVGPPPEVEPGAEPPQPEMKGVVAAGLVRARVWYQAYAEVRLHTMSHEPTGRTWRWVSLEVAGKTIPLTGWWSPPSGLYEKSEIRREVPYCRIGGRAVEVVTTLYTEVRDVRHDLSPEQAEAMAKDAAADALRERLPDGVDPAPIRFEVTSKDDILIGVLATTEIVEDIAQTTERR